METQIRACMQGLVLIRRGWRLRAGTFATGFVSFVSRVCVSVSVCCSQWSPTGRYSKPRFRWPLDAASINRRPPSPPFYLFDAPAPPFGSGCLSTYRAAITTCFLRPMPAPSAAAHSTWRPAISGDTKLQRSSSSASYFIQSHSWFISISRPSMAASFMEVDRSYKCHRVVA